MSNQKVYVQDQDGQPLMPTTPARARRKLDSGKAEVVRRSPFTIRLTYEIKGEKNTQEVTLGIDAGYSIVGFSTVTNNQELIAGELKLRQDISDKLKQRANYRRGRRNRNTRYREPRFDNRKREEGWLAPSIRHKKDEHIRLVNKVKEILPVDKVVVEVAQFDTQKMENPEISGKEYQQGTLRGYNVRNYLLEKFDHTCIYCGATDVPLEVEHIIPRSRGGSDRVSNLTIACHDCNQEKGNQTATEFGHPEIQEQAQKTLKSAAFMNQVRWKIVNQLGVDYTFGHVTKKRRIENDIAKSHVNDAFVIAGGNGHKRVVPYHVKDLRCNNRKLELNRKTYGRSIRRQHYKFQPNDVVQYSNRKVSVRGTHCKGSRVLLENGKSVAKKAIDLIQYQNNWQLLPALKDGASVAKV